jgi:hypothetical protein
MLKHIYGIKYTSHSLLYMYFIGSIPDEVNQRLGFQILLRSKYVASLVKIHWRMLILECSQGCYAVKIWPSDIDLWPWKSIGFQTLLRTKYVPSLVKIHRLFFVITIRGFCVCTKIKFVIPSPTKLPSDIVTLRPSVCHNPCEHSRINILQWI